MATPLANLSWAAAGGWEQAVGEGDDTLSFDTVGIVALHVIVFAVPVLWALFSILSIFACWVMVRRESKTEFVSQFQQLNTDEETSMSTREVALAEAERQLNRETSRRRSGTM